MRFAPTMLVAAFAWLPVSMAGAESAKTVPLLGEVHGQWASRPRSSRRARS
jgi:hypothetical protein